MGMKGGVHGHEKGVFFLSHSPFMHSASPSTLRCPPWWRWRCAGCGRRPRGRRTACSPFPSVTFPSHYSMATGLHPAWHGIVDNVFRDPRNTSAAFNPGVTDPAWWLGEPIWETATKQVSASPSHTKLGPNSKTKKSHQEGGWNPVSRTHVGDLSPSRSVPAPVSRDQEISARAPEHQTRTKEKNKKTQANRQL